TLTELAGWQPPIHRHRQFDWISRRAGRGRIVSPRRGQRLAAPRPKPTSPRPCRLRFQLLAPLLLPTFRLERLEAPMHRLAHRLLARREAGYPPLSRYALLGTHARVFAAIPLL